MQLLDLSCYPYHSSAQWQPKGDVHGKRKPNSISFQCFMSRTLTPTHTPDAAYISVKRRRHTLHSGWVFGLQLHTK